MGSGKDQVVDPWIHLKQSKWQDLKLNGVSNMNLTSPVHQSTSPRLSARRNPCGQTAGGIIPHGLVASKQVVLPACISPCGLIGSADVPPRVGASEFIQLSAAFYQTLDPMDLPPRVASQRRFIVFDQSGDKTRLMFSSVRPPILEQNPANAKVKHPNCYSFQEELPVNDDLINQSDKTSIGCKVDEMHEDTEEIDALLYSDSDEEEASTGRYSPVKRTGRDEEVASSGVPTKRRRLCDEIENDPSLMDTASSASVHGRQQAGSIEANNDAEVSSVNGIAKLRACSARSDDNDKSLKKDRIHEMLGVLRRIIPGGGDGKDASMVLDEGIMYLKSLKAKVFEPVL